MTPDVIMMYNDATNLLNKGKYEKAIPIYKKILSTSSFKEAWINLGNCYRFLDKDNLALTAYTQSNSPSVPFLDGSTAENYPLALNNLGLLKFCAGRDSEAIAHYDTALSVNPMFYDAQWNKSTAWLRKACSGYPELFMAGWEMYEARFKKTPPVSLKNNVPGLRWWSGEYVDSLVILAEQGIGDNIMWARYLPIIASRVGKLTVQCDNSLAYIFKNYNTCFHISECDATHGVPMCSLSRFVSPEIPTYDSSFEFTEKFEFPESVGPNIGIVWAGSPTHANNRNRSVTINRFHRFARYGNLYSLSPGFKSTKYVKGLEIKSWEDTIKYINGLDLVIAVDTSVVHMCGMLGKECWMLQPLKETDFRWGSHNTAWNAWYPSVEVIRNPGSWEDVFDSVEEALKDRYYA